MKLPQNFLDKMKELLKDEYEEFIKCYDEERFYGLRVNTLKVSVEDYNKITSFKLQSIPWCKEGYYYNNGDKPTHHPYYYAGLYYIQEPSAMAPAEFIDILPGDKVLDLCSAPGGKSTQIACKLNSSGLLVSNDISASRIKALVKNIELYGVKNAIVLNETPERLSNKFTSFFDKILVDAPCSGEGMFRKDQSAVKSWSIHSNQKCSVMQKDILEHAGHMLKPGGYILYSTCTFSPDENECIISDFLEKNKNFSLVSLPKHSGIQNGRSNWCKDDFELEKCARFWPHKLKGEGHFLALLRKNDGQYIEYKEEINVIDKKKIYSYYDFCSQNLIKTFEGNFQMYGEYLYLAPNGLPNLNGIKVIRPGWFLGLIKKDRFEPSHMMSVSLKSSDFRNIINFNSKSKDVLRYLKGETLNTDSPKGYNVVCVDGFTLGWAKSGEGILKNNYPAGWRMIG